MIPWATGDTITAERLNGMGVAVITYTLIDDGHGGLTATSDTTFAELWALVESGMYIVAKTSDGQYPDYHSYMMLMQIENDEEWIGADFITTRYRPIDGGGLQISVEKITHSIEDGTETITRSVDNAIVN